jgi:hypothetical protein
MAASTVCHWSSLLSGVKYHGGVLYQFAASSFRQGLLGLVCTVFRLSVALLVVVYVHIDITMPKTESLCWLVTSSRHGARSHRPLISPEFRAFGVWSKSSTEKIRWHGQCFKITKSIRFLPKRGHQNPPKNDGYCWRNPKSIHSWWYPMSELYP